MKNLISKIVGTSVFIVLFSFTSLAFAQEKNVIEEINIHNNNNFAELKNLLADNFDYSNPNLALGKTEATIKFEIAENGKITNVHAESNCKYAAEEVEKVMKELIYRFKNENLQANSYVMPITIAIASR